MRRSGSLTTWPSASICAANGAATTSRSSATGVAGLLHVGKGEVRLDCKLGLLLSMLKPTIEEFVHRDFDKYFGKPKR